jgi:hypothetical protein
MDSVAEIKGLLTQHKTEIELLIKTQHQQYLDQQRRLGDVFEALDKRLVLMENGIVTTAGDVSQARHNTHQIRNALQQISAAQELILSHLGLTSDEPPLPPPTSVSANVPSR